MRNQISRTARHRLHWPRTRRRTPWAVSWTSWSSSRSSPSQRAQPRPRACGSTTEALVTSMARSGAPPAERRASFSRASPNLSSFRSRARRSVRGRLRFLDTHGECTSTSSRARVPVHVRGDRLASVGAAVMRHAVRFATAQPAWRSVALCYLPSHSSRHERCGGVLHRRDAARRVRKSVNRGEHGVPTTWRCSVGDQGRKRR